MKTIDVADNMKQMKIGDLIDVRAENVFYNTCESCRLCKKQTRHIVCHNL
jgi:D-arabinose 1-dehydrogenase-like Zn-dependent alcohol dehydrogenase